MVHKEQKISSRNPIAYQAFVLSGSVGYGNDLLDIVSTYGIISIMNKKQRQTLHRIFERPERSDIPWTNIESLFIAFGAVISEGRGSRVRVALNDVRAVFHRPHPDRVTNKGAVKSVRRFLLEAGVMP